LTIDDFWRVAVLSKIVAAPRQFCQRQQLPPDRINNNVLTSNSSATRDALDKKKRRPQIPRERIGAPSFESRLLRGLRLAAVQALLQAFEFDA
jgi:hypothetical protein